MVDDPALNDDDLRRVPPLAHLSPTQRRRLARGARLVRLSEDEQLFDRDAPAQRFFLLRSGQIRMYRRIAHRQERVLKIVNAGEMFGYASMFAPEGTYALVASAVTPSEVVAFERRALMEILDESNTLALGFLTDLSTRLRARLDELEALTTQSSTLRTVNFLLREVDRTEGGRARIRLNAPKKVIASRLSIQPETLSRVLHALAQTGIIEVEREQIRVLDIDRLRAFAPGQVETVDG